jgi:hypothetical protein
LLPLVPRWHHFGLCVVQVRFLFSVWLLDGVITYPLHQFRPEVFSLFDQKCGRCSGLGRQMRMGFKNTAGEAEFQELPSSHTIFPMPVVARLQSEKNTQEFKMDPAEVEKPFFRVNISNRDAWQTSPSVAVFPVPITPQRAHGIDPSNSPAPECSLPDLARVMHHHESPHTVEPIDPLPATRTRAFHAARYPFGCLAYPFR